MLQKSENDKVSLGTTQASCSIEPCDPFPDLKPPKELYSTIKTKQLEVFGTSNVAMCSTCTKKSVVINSQENTVKWQNCRTTVHNSDWKL